MNEFYRHMFEQMEESERLGFDTTLSGTFHFGGMPQELALKNLRLFAEKVAPAFEREQNAEHSIRHETA